MIHLPLLNADVPATAEWPDRSVVEAALADPAWHPLPFTHYIIKLHGRCNLACDYCYMYEMADQSWRGKPVAMTRATVEATAARITEHLEAHRDEVSEAVISLHGGEALLAGAEGLDYAAGVFRAAVPDGVSAQLTLTTNGVLLTDERILRVLEQHDIAVTLSLDGAREAQDRHRKYANGRGSYDAVMAGAAALRAHTAPERLRNVLCVIDVANDPLETYAELAALGAPQMDFLLPLGNWEQRPPGRESDDDSTPYADWLIPIFDLWYSTIPMTTSVRLFDGIIRLALGGHGSSETIGLGSFQSLDIDTDGSIELVDALKSTFQDAPATGLDVFGNAFDDARLHPGVVARQRGVETLSPTCQACALREVCGGGEYSTRYRRGTGFLNPSVYCADLSKLISHVRDRVVADVAALAAAAGA
ncbi:Radical SAM domain protein [Catenulispora acidiphila DSM 44928]|uniref:Radical SAM domain protein n=1 Tax=Catenulispora acidiphila (strain DSM 44928 / JCM 14897 / NBRC 102108 / NRRL B-24433 / ID139908) TaxID=479433 RepID=C7PY72_CATAD|nr:FxsB family cyclophane-forming radical SAM/SPASM peptide maturase [Catenulispora acidiphila]ACU75362.1 Radical SAM domain protein [Catenulispora acidiphila DSM 44928]